MAPGALAEEKIKEKVVEKTWDDAIRKVLGDSESAAGLHYTEITQQILLRELYLTDGATPTATDSARISASIKSDGEKSPYVRVGPGIYALRSAAVGMPDKSKESSPTLSSRAGPKEGGTAAPKQDTAPLINAFGMYWKRDLVVWRPEPKLLGRQTFGASPVDFCQQKGIYILYDNHDVVYVGRSVDRPLGRRLYEHTGDHLGGRWNRFSWFGLLVVSPDGSLQALSLDTSLPGLVATLEALFIEILEPPRNRRRGDDLSDKEFIQGDDPEFKERELSIQRQLILEKLR